MLDTAPLRTIAIDQRFAGRENGRQPLVTARPPDARDNGTDAVRYLERLARVLPLVPAEALSRAISLILHARTSGRRIYVMGNGGSATTASHFVCDLVKTARVQGLDPVRAFALTDNTPLMTAWANDAAYDRIFAEQVYALVESGDIVIAITASGNSPNVVEGLIAAAARGAWTIGMLGFDGGMCRGLVDVALHIPCDDYGLVEDTHSAITHAITAAVRQAIERESSLAALSRL